MGLRDLVYGVYARRVEKSLDPALLPRHVGVILDGNRRWARALGAAPSAGHRRGADKIEEFVGWCEELGVEVLLGNRLDGPLARGRWPLGTAYAMTVHLAEVTEGVPEPIEDHDELRWLGPDELDTVDWLPGDVPVVAALARRLEG